MDEYLNCEMEEVRRQYISKLIPERFSTKTTPKVIDVTSEKSNQDSYRLLTKLIDKSLTYFEERLQSYYDGLKEVDMNDEKCVQTLMNEFTYLEDYLMQTYRNRRKEGTMDMSQTFENKQDERTRRDIHQKVLTRIHPDFLQGVNLDGTDIMDQMVQDQLMTDDERESIIAEKTSRRKKEAFLMLMRAKLSYNTLVNNFIPAIEQDHPNVAGKLKAVTVEIQETPPTTSLCAVCNMKETVQVKHLAEHLHSNSVISASLHEELRSQHTTNASKWSLLLTKVRNPNFITEAVQSKFPRIYDSLKNDKATNLECRCQSLNLQTISEITDHTIKDIANLEDLRSLLDQNEAKPSVNALIDGRITLIEQEFSSGQSKVRQVNKLIGEEGGLISLSAYPKIQISLPKRALIKPVVVGLQVEFIAPELVAKHLGSGTGAISDIVTVEPRRRKFHKSINVTIPLPKGSSSAPSRTLQLLYSLSEKSPDVWFNTARKVLRAGNDCVTFNTTASARFWVIDCPIESEAVKIATALYEESKLSPKEVEEKILEDDSKDMLKQEFAGDTREGNMV